MALMEVLQEYQHTRQSRDPTPLNAREKGVWQHCVQRVVPNSGMWRDQSDRSICNQLAIIIYSRIINICVFFLLSSCSTSTEDLLIYSRSMSGKDDKTIRRTDGKQKQNSPGRKKLSDYSFKFKRETARALKIYFENVSDGGNETIVETIAIVKQVVFELKTQNRKYAIIEFRCDNSLYTMLPDPLFACVQGAGSRDQEIAALAQSYVSPTAVPLPAV